MVVLLAVRTVAMLADSLVEQKVALLVDCWVAKTVADLVGN
jgi:hypothetical protein